VLSRTRSFAVLPSKMNALEKPGLTAWLQAAGAPPGRILYRHMSMQKQVVSPLVQPQVGFET
jgi:hypothetical protein